LPFSFSQFVESATPKLPEPYTQRICVPEYWLVASQSTERINHSAAIKFAFYVHCKRQCTIFALNPTSESKNRRRSRAQIKAEGIQGAIQWQALIGTTGIETKADLARFLGISRAKVTQVLKRLVNQ